MPFRARSLVAFVALLAACTDEGGTKPSEAMCGPGASASASSSSATKSDVAPPVESGDGSVSVVHAASDVALTGPRVEAKAGDWLIQGGGAVAVVSADDGRVIDYGLEGRPDGLGYVQSLVFDGVDGSESDVQSIEALGAVVHVTLRARLRPVILHTWTWLENKTLRIDSVMVGAGDKPVVSATAGEIFRWGNTPTWLAGHGAMDQGGTFGADFIGRDCQGIAYAARSLDGPFVARVGGSDLAGFYGAARTGESPMTLAPGQASPRRRVVIATSEVSLGDAVAKLPRADPKAAPRSVPIPTGAPARAAVEVARCEPPLESFARLLPDGNTPKGANAKAVLHAPYVRFAATESALVLPGAGCFVARFVAPGHAAGPWTPIESFATAGKEALPRAGTLAFEITEKGAPMPAKIVVKGRKKDGDKDATPDPDWGDDATDGAAVNAVYSADGKGSEPIPPGRYHVFVGRGPEYSLHEEDIVVKADETTTVTAKLERRADTKGWISADLHVHAIPSFDAPVKLSDRMRSLAGVGVEVGVATDHNRITDYGPAIAEANLVGKIAPVIGDEVTSLEVDFGHFNAFPLRADADPPNAKSVAPKELFAEMRAAGASPPIVVQVNHPRMSDIGYFDLMRIDPADIAGSVARSPLYADDYDALEVFNGDHYANIPKVEAAMIDWYALLRAGKRVTATGNSDSHKVTYQDAGEPRNWVAVPDDDPAHFDERAFVDAIRAGRVVVSNGPFITMTAAGKEIGDTIEPGDVDVEIHVEAPSWIDVSSVELVKSGRLDQVFDGPFEADGKRFDKTFKEHVDKGDFIVAIVRGAKPMRWLARDDATPFGFTNPIFVRP